MYNIEEMRKLYPEWFTETHDLEVIFYLFLFYLLMLAYYLYLRYKIRAPMIIDNNKQEIGDEIDYKFRGNVSSYKLMIRKVSDKEWVAYKQFRSKQKVSLRRGDLRRIIDYMNRNFRYNDRVIGFD
ncbi:MAG: hypothetical protein OIN86_09160 [Candidatus Methanoperedens sp.]|nr:hypothetical protein [Candidatus Methanoperedens sp.]CAG1000249.1 hypothetical protein METP1_02835 [Methanosarcinales archaeon]